MSARSIKRAHARSVARRAVVGTATVLGAGAIAASSAQAANFPVTNTNDSGAGSLYAAITSANGTAAADTITFTGAGASGTITLTTPLPDITTPVDIQGPGATALTLDGAGFDDGIFRIGNITAANQPVSISGLRLVNGFNDGTGGGSIINYENGANAAELTVSNVVINNSRSKYEGGAIFSDGGSLTVTGTTITRSRNDGYSGGAIYVDDTDADLPIEVSISGSTIRNNGGTNGGGIYLDSVDAGVEIINTTIANNTALIDGGGLSVDNVLGPLTISSSTISGNNAFGFGGGAEISESEELTIRNSTVADNYANFGGGLYLYNGGDYDQTIANSTVSGNEAIRNGGGIGVYGETGDELFLRSSIVAGNIAGELGPDISQYQALGEAITAGNSVLGTITGGPPLEQVPAGTNKLGVTDPQLQPLADNGGPTQTALPTLSSPAVVAGVSNGLTVDQRGQARTVIQPTVPLSAGSDGTDVGAAELAAVPPPSVDGAKVSAKKTQKQKGKKVVIQVKAGAAEEVTIVAKGSVKLGKKKVALKSVTKKAAAGKQLKLKLKPKQKNGSKKILSAIADGQKVKANLTVTLTDAEGATETAKPKVNLK